MDILAGEKSKYAAACLALGFCNNVEAAFKEAEGVLNGKWNRVTSDESFYLIYDPNWRCPYIVKRTCNPNGDNKVRVSTDDNFKRFRW